MIYLKSTPIGIDVAINDIQKAVANAVSWTNYNAFHRAYKNVSSGGIIPEVYKVKTQPKIGEYEEVLTNDNLYGSSFFVVADTRNTIDNGNLVSTTVSMIFQMNLEAVTGISDSRQDEELHVKVSNAINSSAYGKVSSIITGINNVYTEFDTNNVQFDDIQPFHCFRIDIDVSYMNECKAETEKQIADINGNQIVYI